MWVCRAVRIHLVVSLVVPCLCRGRPRSAALRPLLLRDEARDPFHALARLAEQLLRLFRRQPRERGNHYGTRS